MKRIKRHKIKKEMPETSASYSREHEEHDLAYYIHDRVELMHQVFSILKYKELKAMAPECVRNLAVGDLQELCTEELLGISSKRLLATLDGAEPPSDTESSSASPTPDQMETISLDSISSDEEILSQSSKKKKHKHRRNSKSKKRDKQKLKDSIAADETAEVSKASRAGLTVLELLELQARARAIRAQLQNDQARKQFEAATADVQERHDSDDEVEIKEEAPDVVEISSGDEKPDLSALQYAAQKTKETSKTKEASKVKEPSKPKELQKPKEPETTNKEKESPEKTAKVTRRINDLIITVPQSKATRKIKLNRNKVTVTVPIVTENSNAVVESRIVTIGQNPIEETLKNAADKSKKKKKNKKKKSLEKDGSDHDEITLQLSDSEKMDLLEDLNEKNYERLSSNSSDSESSSSDSEADISTEKVQSIQTDSLNDEIEKDSNKTDMNTVDNKVESSVEENNLPANESTISLDIESSNTQEDQNSKENVNNVKVIEEHVRENNEKSVKDITCTDNVATTKGDTSPSQNHPDGDKDSHVTSPESIHGKNDLALTEECLVKDTNNTDLPVMESKDVPASVIIPEKSQPEEVEIEKAVETENVIKIATVDDIPVTSGDTQSKEQELDTNVDKVAEKPDLNKGKEGERDISEGELSDRESSEVEVFDIQPEVVCISDDEKQKSHKKKKKKDKKAKKDKKNKKLKQDFREGADQNFYKDTDKLPIAPDVDTATKVPIDILKVPTETPDDYDDVYEILELSDDSSCYEVEGTVLSKEPTAEEIQALSARIDEIKREDIINDVTCESTITAAENDNSITKSDDSEQETYMCWKDRYLDSTKVKKVLTTANILNALRKKNKELKRKIEESKKREREAQVIEEKVKVLEEGSIEHYQTLQGSSKHINPVPEENNEDVSAINNEDGKTADGDGKTVMEEETVTKEMKKDAKQLLKMYRKLLNSKKSKRREKKRKRKQKKEHGDGAVCETANTVV